MKSIKADPGEVVVPVDRFRPIVGRWLAGFAAGEEGYLELEAGSPVKADAWRRRLSDDARGGRRGWFTFLRLDAGDVDEFLTAAGLTHLWHTELRDLLPPGARTSDEEFDETCAACGRWIDWSRSDHGVRVELKQPHRWTLWWSVCSLCYARQAPRLRTLDCTGRIRRRISDELLLALYERYIRDEVGLEKLAEQVWQQHGFPAVRACTASLFHAWRRDGWPMRDRWTSKRLNGKHRLRKPGQRIPEADLRKMHTLHRRRMLSINQIAKQTNERYGYASPSSCATAISHAWQLLGLQRTTGSR